MSYGQIGKSIAIVKQINNADYDDEVKGAAVLNVLNMKTLSAISKHDLFAALRWMLELSFDIPEDGDGASEQAARLVRKWPCPFNTSVECSKLNCYYCSWRKKYDEAHQKNWLRS